MLKGSRVRLTAVSVRARELVSLPIHRTESVGIHLREGSLSDRDNGKGDTDHRDQASSDIIATWRCKLECLTAGVHFFFFLRSLQNVESGDLDHGQQAGDNQSCGNKILLHLPSEISTCSAAQQDRRRDDASQHGKGVLES